jgi:hypothetical protein
MAVPETAFVNALVLEYGDPTQRKVFATGFLGEPPIADGDRCAQFDNWTYEDIFSSYFKDCIYTANTKLGWSWPTADVDLTCRIEVYPVLKKYGVWLEMDQGLRARAEARRVADAQEAERQAAERDRAVNAFQRAVRPGSPTAPVPQDPALDPNSTKARQAQEAVKLAAEKTLNEVEARRKQEEAAQRPIQVTEMVKGKAWRFGLHGPTSLQAASAHVRAAAPGTIALLRGGRAYRFVAPGVPRGQIHVSTRYMSDPRSPVTDALVPRHELPDGLTKIFPREDMVTLVWQDGPDVGPVEIVLEETTNRAVARMVDSQPTGF